MLTHLILNDNALKDEGILHLSTSQVFRNLISLDIAHNDLKENGAYILSVTQMITQLRYLNLTHNQIGESGCKCIAESDAFPLLARLVIYTGNGINAKAKAHIHRSKKLRSLVRIE